MGKWIKENFLAFPNPLVNRILRDDLTMVEYKVLLLCVRWSIGYGKEICTPSLTALSNTTGHARKYLSRVLKSLVKKGYLTLVNAADVMDEREGGHVLSLSAAGLRDYTRIGESDPIMWRDIFRANRTYFLNILGFYEKRLGIMKECIKERDWARLEAELSRAKEVRRRMFKEEEEDL